MNAQNVQKYALVTGASRGIGKAVALRLSEMGYALLINYKANEAAALETLRMIEAHGGTACLLPFDVAGKDHVRKALDQWHEEHPGAVIEVLVNNAGNRRDALMAFMEDEQWSSVLGSSLEGMYHVTRHVLKNMLLNRYGRIINMASLSGLKGLPGQVNYSAAKAGMIGATKALAQEVARRNITVNAVAPGFIRTDMTGDLNETELKAQIPANRFGTAEEVADLVAFLASSKAGYITGQVIGINGGLYT
ncbi:MAG TPA: 3-oxoacyl-ACP reductase FabG [Edaphocola sp.]|nr:3-oxoacyl-ACP reductase FabG [Edaphocola sp.]